MRVIMTGSLYWTMQVPVFDIVLPGESLRWKEKLSRPVEGKSAGYASGPNIAKNGASYAQRVSKDHSHSDFFSRH